MSDHQKKILVVDDEPLVVEALRLTLEDEAEIISARSGEEAVELARKHEFVVLLTDLRMPGMSGQDLIEAMRFLSPHTICLVLTGQVEEPYPQGRPENVFACMRKPFALPTLVQTLHAATSEYILRKSNGSGSSRMTNPCF